MGEASGAPRSLSAITTCDEHLTTAFPALPSRAGAGLDEDLYLARAIRRSRPARLPSLGHRDRRPPGSAWSRTRARPGVAPGSYHPVQLADSVATAYCQPNVGAYFTFISPTSELAGWQSGLYGGLTPNAAYHALRNAPCRERESIIFSASLRPARPRARPWAEAGQPAADQHLRSSLATYGGTPTCRLEAAKVQVGYGIAAFAFRRSGARDGVGTPGRLADRARLIPTHGL